MCGLSTKTICAQLQNWHMCIYICVIMFLQNHNFYPINMYFGICVFTTHSVIEIYTEIMLNEGPA